MSRDPSIRKFKSDSDDMKHWVEIYAETARCSGGRIIHSRYCCLHCGSIDPQSKCASPKPESKKQ